MVDYYTVNDILDRIENTLGQRLSPAAIHLEGARTGTEPNARIRITAGLPAPINPGGRPLHYETSAIEAWLEEHPRLRAAESEQRLRDALTGTSSRSAAVTAARVDGLSWAQIAGIISDVDQRPVTRQAVAKRYGRT